jgi:L-threonylcarbamoyladenylate synthase
VSPPEFVLRRADRGPDGELTTAQRAEVERILLGRGFVLLPSDTAYSLAARLLSERTRRDINTILDREQHEPISQAFSGPDAVRAMIGEDPVVTRLMDRFMPGPITIVCPARRVPDAYARGAMSSQNHTIGLRVTESVEERAVAAASGYPVTTVPVRDPASRPKRPVTSFDRALELVGLGMDAVDGRPWCAIDGVIRHTKTSTVVRVHQDGRVELRRPGALPFEEIEAGLD